MIGDEIFVLAFLITFLLMQEFDTNLAKVNE